ncbi:MAG: 2-C-methyl-D-erythritol 2,4-cyclodiphosphate synthase [Clostridiales bacterium]|nr:2-C-methyl-D-erythritol 2,4-cyclodiphosphate synthase [Clostridiales bacterium]
MRIGNGYDAHRLAAGRRLVIGGVEIPYEKGLVGHSDADVLVHAIMDALLGAAGLRDIGVHFPDSDPALEGADSLDLLAKVGELIKEAGFSVINIDSVVIAQAPKIGPYISAMRGHVSKILGLDAWQVNVKATTEEGMGFTGAGLGIAATCVCLLESGGRC